MFGVLKLLLPWIATTILSAALILSTHDQQAAPLQNRVNDLVAVGAYPVSSSVKVIALWSENRRLRRELAERSVLKTQGLDLLRENDRLRQMLGFRARSQMELSGAEVVGLTSDEGVRGLLIDRGYDDGIATGQAVITPEGLIGRIYRVHGSSAAVQLLGDPNLGVAARLVRGEESGIVHASSSGRLRLDGVPVSAETTIGDSVVTSGQGGVFPPGLLIGFTTKVSPSMEGWLLNVEVVPSVDIRRIVEVFVVKTADMNAEVLH